MTFQHQRHGNDLVILLQHPVMEIAGRSQNLEVYADGTMRCFEKQYEDGQRIEDVECPITEEMLSRQWVFGYRFDPQYQAPVTEQGVTLTEMKQEASAHG